MAKHFFLYLFCLPALLLSFSAHAQNSLDIYGPTTVKRGEKVVYTAVLHDYNAGNPEYCWSVTGGTFKLINDGCQPPGVPQGSCMTCTNIEVTWDNNATSGTVYVSTSNGYSAMLNVIVVVPIQLSSITPAQQHVKYNIAPAAFTIPVPTGGNGTFIYQWQRLKDDLTWENIPGATARSYTPTAFTRNSSYRVSVFSYDATVYSRQADVIVHKPLYAGEIYGYQRIPANSKPLTIKGEPASGDDGKFVYQWQESANKTTWTNINGASAQYYTPPAATATKYYRRKVTSTFGSTTADAYTNIVTIVVAGSQANNMPAAVQADYTQPLRQQANLGTALNQYNSSAVKQWTVLKAGVKDAAAVDALTTKDAAILKGWYDGLGRQLQQVDIQSTVTARDVVQQTLYDDLGRNRETFMPFVDSSQTGVLRTDAGTRQQSFYKTLFPSENFFYARQVTDAAGNTLSSSTAGNSWAGNNAGASGFTRALAADEQVWRWVLVNDNTPALPATADRFYSPSEVTVTEAIDLYGRRNLTYTDRQGRKVLQKLQYDDAGANWLYSYYVYDAFNQLRYTIHPKAVKWMMDNAAAITSSQWNLDLDIKNNLCSAMQYDEKGRMIIRKEPAIEESWIVYDKKNRPVLTQSPEQRANGQWSYMIYDKRGRVVVAGIYASTATRQQLQDQIDQAAIGDGALTTLRKPAPVDLVVSRYSGAAVYAAKNSVTLTDGFLTPDNTEMEVVADPNLQDELLLSQVMTDQDYLGLNNNSNCTPLTIHYYDDYNFPGADKKPFNAAHIGKLKGGVNAVSPVRSRQTEGFITGSSIRVFYPEGSSGPEWLTTVNYYDNRGRVIQSHVDNIFGATDVESSQYSFAGQVLSTYLHHTNPWGKPQKTIEITKRYLYYDNGPLQQTWMAINDLPEKPLETFYYNTLGQLSRKILGNHLESLDYTYNLKGWPAGINAEYAKNKSGQHFFGASIHYNEDFNTSQIDGSITGMLWRRAGAADAAMAYGFQYDAVGRLKQAYFTQNKGTGTTGWSQAEKNYTVDKLNYDENGNITSMRSQASYLGMTKAVDDLTYSYLPNTNILQKVQDAAGDNQQQDFKDGPAGTGDEYTYDKNGALKSDANKDVALSQNSSIEKPDVLVFGKNANKTLKYIYDASGYRWQKLVKDGNTTTSYTYVGGFVYKNDSTLLHFAHESGRTRYARLTYSGQYAFVTDYFITDHMGNIRTVLTEGTDTALYKATFEPVRDAVEEATFSNRTSTREPVPTNLPFYNANNKYWCRLNAGDPAKRVGASLVLKVMAGDVINIATKAYYKQMASSNTGTAVNDMLHALINAMLGSGATVINNGHNNLMEGNNTILNTSDLNAFFSSKQTENNTAATNPKAYLNFVLFDEDFNMVSGSAVRINKGPDVLQDYLGYLEVPKNGFLYVYTSNESPVDVWFDDLAVTHRSGPLLQESTLYPYGLEIASQSSRALMKTANEYLYQGKELDEDFALNYYYFDARYYDPQLGRFLTMDPVRGGVNAYTGMGNSPTMFVDPDGRFPWLVVAIGAAFGAFSGYKIAEAKGAQGFWEWFGYIGGGAVIGGASAYAGSAVGAGLGATLTNGTNMVTHAGLAATMAGGAVGGATSGLGFGLLAGSDNLFGAMSTGMVSGMVGGGVGAWIGGGAGALAGGFTGGAISAGFNGGDFGSILKAGLMSGAVAWGVYQVNAAINYKASQKLFKDNAIKLSRKQFNVISRLVQRSFVRGKEYGGWLEPDGSISWAKGTQVDTGKDPAVKSPGALSFHTHPNNGPSWHHEHSGLEPALNPVTGSKQNWGDMQWDINNNRSSLVFSRSNVFYHDLWNIEAPRTSVPLMPIRFFNPYPYNTFLPY